MYGKFVLWKMQCFTLQFIGRTNQTINSRIALQNVQTHMKSTISGVAIEIITPPLLCGNFGYLFYPPFHTICLGTSQRKSESYYRLTTNSSFAQMFQVSCVGAS